jgi:transposase-like protein
MLQTKPKRKPGLSKAPILCAEADCNERQRRALAYLRRQRATIEKPVTSHQIAEAMGIHPKTLRKWVLNPLAGVGVRSGQRGFYLDAL